MHQIVNVHEAKTHFSKFLDRVMNGEEIIIAKGDKPWARSVALAAPTARQPGLFRGQVLAAEALAPLEPDELAAWER